MALKNAKIITVTSVKGGVGKSTFTLSLAKEFSNRQKKTLILDLDLYTGAIAMLLKVENSNNIFNFAADLMTNSFDGTEPYIKKYSDYIDVLPATRDPRSISKIDVKYIDLLIKKLIYSYDIILVDTNHTMDAFKLVSMDLSDQIIYLITNDIADMKNMKTMMSIYKDMDKHNYSIVFNSALSDFPYNKYDVQNVIGTDVNYILTKKYYYRNLHSYILNGDILEFPKSEKNILKLVDDLLK